MLFVFIALLILYVIASAVTILVVLVQSGRGGGLSGLVSGGSSIGDQLGATGAEKTLNRWTTYCAIGFLVLTVLLVLVSQKVYNTNVVEDLAAEAAAKQTTQPATPNQPGVAPAIAPTGTPAIPAQMPGAPTTGE